MRPFHRSAYIACVFGFVSATSVFANNTTMLTAHAMLPGGPPVEAAFTATDQQRWYAFDADSGRSYCAELQAGGMFDTSNASMAALVEIHAAGGALVASSDITWTGWELATGLAQACVLPPVFGRLYIRATPSVAGEAFNFRISVVETTLRSNWFFLGGDYSAFTLVRNATRFSVTCIINYREASSGSVVASKTVTLSPEGGFYIDARSLPAALLLVSGTVDIAHTGAPNAILASTTVLSATTGLSFDVPFVVRSHW